MGVNTLKQLKMNSFIIHNLIKKAYSFKQDIRLKEFEFKLEKAVFKGKVFRTCASIYTTSPAEKDNWHSKYCAIVILGVKVLSFSAYNTKSPTTTDTLKKAIQAHRNNE